MKKSPEYRSARDIALAVRQEHTELAGAVKHAGPIAKFAAKSALNRHVLASQDLFGPDGQLTDELYKSALFDNNQFDKQKTAKAESLTEREALSVIVDQLMEVHKDSVKGSERYGYLYAGGAKVRSMGNRWYYCDQRLPVTQIGDFEVSASKNVYPYLENTEINLAVTEDGITTVIGYSSRTGMTSSSHEQGDPVAQVKKDYRLVLKNLEQQLSPESTLS